MQEYLNMNLCDPVAVSTGVKLGCVLLPTLFLVLMDKSCEENCGEKAEGYQLGTQNGEDIKKEY